MRKVKIVKIEPKDIYDSYGRELYVLFSEGITDWEEVSDEDYEFLMSQQHRRYIRENSYILVTQVEKAVPRTITQLKKEIAKQVELEEKRKQKYLEETKKQREKVAARKKAKEIAKAKAILEKEGLLKKE